MIGQSPRFVRANVADMLFLLSPTALGHVARQVQHRHWKFCHPDPMNVESRTSVTRRPSTHAARPSPMPALPIPPGRVRSVPQAVFRLPLEGSERGESGGTRSQFRRKMVGFRRQELLLIVAACLIAATKLSGGSFSVRGKTSSSQVRSPPPWGHPR